MSRSTNFGQLHLVGKISLWFSMVAVIGLIAAIFLAGTPQASYADSIQSLSLTKKNLPFIMLIGGLLLAAGTGFTTWLITLYSTFRVAGPLYRFQKNLETGIHTGNVPRVRIRNKDHLQQESLLLESTAATTEVRLADLNNQIIATIDLLASESPYNEQALNARLALLRSQLAKVRYDEH